MKNITYHKYWRGMKNNYIVARQKSLHVKMYQKMLENPILLSHTHLHAKIIFIVYYKTAHLQMHWKAKYKTNKMFLINDHNLLPAAIEKIINNEHSEITILLWITPELRFARLPSVQCK